jgi:tetratricopeptide (TPR) repeat protein
MVRTFLPVVLLLAAFGSLSAHPVEPGPLEIVERATRAFEDDSTRALRSEWQTAIRVDPMLHGPLLGLATLAGLAFENTAAESLYAILLARAPKDRFTASAMLGRGLAYADRDVRDSAIVWLARAQDTAAGRGELRVQVNAMLERSYLERYLNRRRLADSLVSAAARLTPAGDVELQARVLDAGAAAGVRSGDPAAAAAAARAGEMAERVGARRLAVRCRLHAADARARGGNYDAIWTDLRVVAQDAAALHDLHLEAVARALRGTHLITYGVVGTAQADLRAAAAIAHRTANTNLEAWALANQAQTFYYLGDPAAGGERARRAIDLFAMGFDPFGSAFSTALRGDLAAGDGGFESAARCYERSAAEFSAAGYPQGVAHASELLASVALRFGDLDRGEQLLRHAWDLTGSAMAGRRPEVDLQLGTLALRRGRWAEAETYFRRGRTGEVTGGDLRYYFDARLAEIRLRRGDTLAAEQMMKRAADALDTWRATLTDQDLRPMAFQATQDEVDPDLGVATILAAIATRGRVSQAFALAEQRRARDLHDRLLRLDGMRATPGDSGATVATAPMQPVTTGELRRALPEGVALVEFVTGLGGEPTTVFVLTADTERAFVTDPVDSLAPGIDRLTTLLASGGDGNALGRRLGTSLLRAAVATLSPTITTLLLVPDGALQRLPFDALLLDDGKRVFERYATAVVPSAGVALDLWRRPARSGPTTFLAFGDPVFSRRAVDDDGSGILRSAFDATGGLPRLRASGAEARRAASFADHSIIRLREAASEAWLKRSRLDGFRVIHFATHALVDEASSARTALALSAGGGEDGFVGPGELAALSMPADLVVLSACRTAGGRLVRGEGLQGLTAPLLAAGARSVLATQWPIEDRTAGRMTERFYRALAGGATVAQALRSARLELMRAGVSPRQWGAFVLVGDPTVRIPLRVPSTPGWIWVLGAATLIVLGGFAFARGRRSRPASVIGRG